MAINEFQCKFWTETFQWQKDEIFRVFRLILDFVIERWCKSACCPTRSLLVSVHLAASTPLVPRNRQLLTAANPVKASNGLINRVTSSGEGISSGSERSRTGLTVLDSGS